MQFEQCQILWVIDMCHTSEPCIVSSIPEHIVILHNTTLVLVKSIHHVSNTLTMLCRIIINMWTNIEILIFYDILKSMSCHFEYVQDMAECIHIEHCQVKHCVPNIGPILKTQVSIYLIEHAVKIHMMRYKNMEAHHSHSRWQSNMTGWSVSTSGWMTLNLQNEFWLENDSN